ncbi:M3 family metallopeptidase [Pelomicrobium sp. G1]|uniref:M3 family metallopeptidase n=1 Tax=unclassified Pelomicrobium TaxID=2815318 RepID=UPI003F769FBC
MPTETNPLLDFSGLPRFPEIRPEHVAPAVAQVLAQGRAVIGRVEQSAEPPTWETVVQPLEDANERVSRAWGPVAHLNAVMNTPALREAYNANLPRITQYYAELGQNRVLFEKYKAIQASPAFQRLTRSQRRVIENEIRDFRLGGAELPEASRARFLEIQERLAQLQSRFSDNLLDATNAFAYYASEEEVAGIPTDALEAAQEAARQEGKPGWKFTLHMPSYLPVMQYADHRPLREAMYRAYVTRASDLGPEALDNTPLIREILKLRAEEARLLGFASYAELSLQTKMARSPGEVLDFLHELAAKAKPYAERDLAELQEFAARELKLPRLEAWDLAYASEKLRLARYAFSEQEVKQYFPETRVLPGLFRLVETLFGVRIERAQAPVWHPDVKFFRILSESGELVGQFYADLYARPSKRGGAWMDDAITRRRLPSGLQAPAAYLTCNFSAPQGGRPALLTHDEVITLFHEFGHGLHHLLTRVDELAVAGINGVEWDAVELPSQFMENFCWEWEVVAPMSGHVDTGEPLPRSLFDKMRAARNFQAGMQTVRQLEFALFDMRLHHGFDPERGDFMELLDEVRARVAVVFPPAYNRFPHGFSHIFAGGYAAGYYSYKWAEVLSADAYSLFEEHGVLSQEIGRRFRDEILAVGGSRPALESFVAFRGREPRIEALLRHSGMIAETA